MNYIQFIESRHRIHLKIIALRAQGWTLQRIADKHKISKQRVGQIIKRASRQ